MFTETLDVATVSERIVESVLPLFDALSSGLLLEPDGSLKAAAWGGAAREQFRVGDTFPPGVGLAARVLATAAPAWCHDVLAEQGLHGPDDLRRRIEATGHRAVLAVPLRATGAVIGVLTTMYRMPRAFADEEMALLQTFADHAATAIENARLYRRAEAAYQELTRAQDRLVQGETLRALGELAAGAAHHLNNLLAVIVGRVQLLRRWVEDPEVQRALGIVERAALDSAEVVRRMWTFSQARRAPALEAVDLNALAREALELTRPRWHDESQLHGLTIAPRWPHFSIACHGYLDDPEFGNLAAVSFGETFALYRAHVGAGWWEVGIQAGVFAIFDLDADSSDLINADYFVAGVLGYQWQTLSALARLFHQSSHLGDEFLLRQTRVDRINLSYEGLDVRLSWEAFGDALRLYGGGGRLVRRDPPDLEPWFAQYGVEFQSPWPAPEAGWRPVAAVDVQHREQNAWAGDLSLRAGVQVDGVLATRNLQVLFEYFRGHSPSGQFFRREIDFLDVGVHFHF